MLGEWIKAQRDQRGWSQAGLAKKAGLEQSYISKLERNRTVRPGADVLRRLAMALGVEYSDIVQAAITTSPAKQVNDPPISELRALGWSDERLQGLTADWGQYSSDRQLKIIGVAQQMYRQHQEAERQEREQQEALDALLQERTG